MRYLILFAAQALSYTIVSINIRALNRNKYAFAGITDFCYAGLNFFIIRKIVDARSVGEAMAYASGGACGSLFAMWLTKHWTV